MHPIMKAKAGIKTYRDLLQSGYNGNIFVQDCYMYLWCICHINKCILDKVRINKLPFKNASEKTDLTDDIRLYECIPISNV